MSLIKPSVVEDHSDHELPSGSLVTVLTEAAQPVQTGAVGKVRLCCS